MRVNEEGGGGGPQASGAVEAPWPRAAYSWMVVAIFLTAYTLSFIDRMILSLLIAPVRAAFGIGDFEVSLLIGLAFALFYAFMGLPLGWIADRGNRKLLIMSGISFWSAMTAACGLAGSYATLFLARMGVGVGEAALSPAAYSVLSDLFPRHKLARAIAVYSLGVPIGAGLALVLGSFVVKAVIASPPVHLPLIGTVDAWRLIFFYVGAPGILVALLIGMLVKEPVRRGKLTVQTGNAPSLLRFISSRKVALGAHFGCNTMLGLTLHGLMAWLPTFFSRTYGMAVTEAGLYYGVLTAIGGSLGFLMGGWYADRLFQRGRADAHMHVLRLSLFLGAPFYIAMPLMPNATSAFVMLGFGALFSAMHGVAPAALQMITPNEYRARLSALYLCVINLIGVALGPSLIAAITQFVFKDDNALRWSIFIVMAGGLSLATLMVSLGMKAYAQNVRSMDRSYAGGDEATA